MLGPPPDARVRGRPLGVAPVAPHVYPGPL